MKKMNVGVALQGDPQKGITLIALIITIIVMLILVGVTINVALNGGLIEKAKDAKDLTQKEVEREELLSTAIGLYNVNAGITQSELVTKLANLNNEYIVDNEKTVASSKYVVSGPSGITWEINLITAEVKEYEETASETWYDIAIINPDQIEWEELGLETETSYTLFFENESGVISNLFIITGDNENNVFDGASYIPNINNDGFYYRWNKEDLDWNTPKEENDEPGPVKANITIEKVKFTTVTGEDWDWTESFPESKIDKILTKTVSH